MWTEDIPKFEGKYFSIKNALCEPKPIQKPHPPLTIGGSGEKLTLKVVAEYGSRSNWSGSVAEFKHKLNVLRAHCERVGRDYGEIEKSWFGRVLISDNRRDLRNRLKELYLNGNLYFRRPQTFEDWLKKLDEGHLVGTLSDCLERIRAYTDLGVSYFMLNFLDFPSTRSMKKMRRGLKSQ